MNKFLTYAGKQPVYLGDIDFMQNAAAYAQKNIARALMDSDSDSLNAILQGVRISFRAGGEMHYSSGVVVINGEILPVPAATITASALDLLYFHVDSVMSGARTFGDGESHLCFESRSVSISTVSTGGILVSSVPRLHDDPVVDDAVYSGSVYTGYITNGRLIRKSGLWLCDLAFDVPENASVIGSVSFENLSSSHYAAFTGSTFQDQLILLNSATANYNSMLVSCIMSKTSANNKVTLEFNYASSAFFAQIHGTGSYRKLLPIF